MHAAKGPLGYSPDNRMNVLKYLSPLAFAALALAGCGGGGGGGCGGCGLPPPGAHLPKHIVVIVQENRTIDNLFQKFPGADTASSGLNSKNQMVPLQPVHLTSLFDLDHEHSVGFINEYNNGLMNGWDHEVFTCGANGCGGISTTAYGYVPPSDVQPYYQLASEFVLADHVLQTNMGPSYPAHQYLIGAQSGRPLAEAENPGKPHTQGGCDSPPEEGVLTVDLTTQYPGKETQRVFPCAEYTTIFDLLAAKHLTWRYYTPLVDDLWDAPEMVAHLAHSPDFNANVVTPETAILNDITNGNLASVSYVVPRPADSDHARMGTAAGPGWVAAIVNTIGHSRYWQDTAIVVTWDDWGGWFDHYRANTLTPFGSDPYEYGFRVPLVLISPYAKAGTIDHTPRDFTAILHFIEDVFQLGPLPARAPEPASLEQLTDDLFGDFNFSAVTPLTFKPVGDNGFPPSYFLNLGPPSQKDLTQIKSET